MPRPNILYIHSHDTGRYIQPYGYAVPTPHLQHLAEEGVLFRQAFCAAPTCSPSRACLLTGEAAHSNGMLGLSHRGFAMRDYRHHLVHTLRTAGYFSILTGIQHIDGPEQDEPYGGRIGYDYVTPRASIWDQSRTEHDAVDFLESQPSQPFFLDVGFFETHRPFPADISVQDINYCRPPVPLPDTPETRRDMAGFIASARRLDARMGTVFAALERSGMRDNTLVICTTDHGVAFPEMKCNLTDHGLGVMLIMRGPGGFTGGRVLDAPVSHLDLFPTICELLQIEPPAWLQGRSLLPLVRGAVDTLHEALFSEVTYHASYEPQRAVRTAPWKYIRRFDAYPVAVLPNCDNSASKDSWLQAGWKERLIPEEQLYDLALDPQERHNLAADPQYATVLARLREQLHAWMQETADPLLEGPVPAPAQAVIIPVDQFSPEVR